MKRPLRFVDYPDFRPNLTPEQCIRAGIFGGIYFNPIGGKPGVISDSIDININEFPRSWFKGLDTSMYLARKYDKNVNKYKVVAGMNQEYWERKGWIHPQDPRGWFQWYMRFYMGRRTEDDRRQIDRWKKLCGERGRWRLYLLNRIRENGGIDNKTDYPRIRQTLLHWAFEI
jgi:hypothetical protein